MKQTDEGQVECFVNQWQTFGINQKNENILKSGGGVSETAAGTGTSSPTNQHTICVLTCGQHLGLTPLENKAGF